MYHHQKRKPRKMWEKQPQNKLNLTSSTLKFLPKICKYMIITKILGKKNRVERGNKSSKRGESIKDFFIQNTGQVMYFDNKKKLYYRKKLNNKL